MKMSLVEVGNELEFALMMQWEQPRLVEADAAE